MSREHVEGYLCHKWRLNNKSKTLLSSLTFMVLFLTFYEPRGKDRLEEVVREDIEAFVEHEQDRGIKITTVRTRLACIFAFLRFLADRDIVPEAVLKRNEAKAP